MATALDILDAYGLPDLTMRRIAETLGVQPSALYWHVASKQDLLRAVADTILADLPSFRGGDLVDLRLWAARFHTCLMAHRNAAELVWSVLTLQTWEAGIGWPIEQGLLDRGFDPAVAHAGATGVLHLVLAHAFDEDQRRQAVRLKVLPGAPTESAVGLDEAVRLLVAGLQASQPC